jgi:heptosyltransferase III
MAAALGYAKVFLGPDSGPMHVVAAVGVPCVIAFSASTLPGNWFPHGVQHQVLYRSTSCRGCSLESCTVEGRRCLTSITVAEMATAVDKVLRGAL